MATDPSGSAPPEGKTAEWFLNLLGRDPEVLAAALARSRTDYLAQGRLVTKLATLANDTGRDLERKVTETIRDHRAALIRTPS